MRFQQFASPDNNGYFTISENNDCEYSNPIEWHKDMIMAHFSNLTFNHLLLSLQSPQPPKIPTGYQPIDYLRQIAAHQAGKTWNEELEKIVKTKVPDALWKTLQATSKKDQHKSLKNLTVSGEQLTSWYFKSYQTYGYLFSNYTFDFLPTGIDKASMPSLAYKEKSGSLTIIGNSRYTEKQLKQTIDHRRRRIVRVLDKENEWHCIFYDYRSMNGNETEKQGPHVHYISDKWGITRDEVIKRLSQKHYSLPCLHIGFFREPYEDDDNNSK
ncbi:hypothetical protein [Sediminibacterium ginsengisoli]|uniref:Uncharacterized protein n=1 Tax=Sediminibacterium ginsengisoli TaxID=413434 RepID=A0A1T4NZD7_9BACT|nr:hypothetical protein [Sediminibacterium ginsengisoli]SJZ84561.1 hypothetical protein SAMN04488132_10565 [Sediminibacterium ginsengisoli]